MAEGFAAGGPNSSTVTSDERLAGAYDFDLPAELIAQSHAHPRDASRLLVLGERGMVHARFSQLAQFLRPDDLLVLNETRVIAARLLAQREPGGGRVEILLLNPASGQRYDASALRWLALVKPGRKMRPGQRVRFGDLGTAVVASESGEGLREVEFDLNVPFETLLERSGKLPLPPYIHNDSQEAQEDYQTIFARNPGSVAAPTASLHFTAGVMESLRAAGVETATLTLDVGLGTFRPMKALRLDEHVMHAEQFEIPADTAAKIATAKEQGRRIVAAGTTVVRALEGSAAKHGAVKAGEDSTNLFIQPGFTFRVVDAMITNFHLPQSTLLVLVSAFAGRQRVLDAYAAAVNERYRFFSFGDAMLIEPQS